MPVCFSADSTRITLLFAGDVMGHLPQIKASWDSTSKSYDYTQVFKFIKPIVDTFDCAIANLEVTLAGPPYSGYPQFSSPDELAIGLKTAGFDVLATSNNHSLDRGKQGLTRTNRILDSIGLKRTGTYSNQLENDSLQPFLLELKGIKIALLNYTYGTNGIPVPEGVFVNLIEPKKIITDIDKARQKGADIVIPFLHWGLEYQREPDLSQKKLAQLLITKGCEAIVGSHPHVVQPVVVVDTMIGQKQFRIPIAYSLGNLVSNQRDRYRDGGILFSLTITKSSNRTYVSDFGVIPYWVFRGTLDGLYQYYILPTDVYLNNPLKFGLPPDAHQKLVEFDEDTRQLMGSEKSKK